MEYHVLLRFDLIWYLYKCVSVWYSLHCIGQYVKRQLCFGCFDFIIIALLLCSLISVFFFSFGKRFGRRIWQLSYSSVTFSNSDTFSQLQSIIGFVRALFRIWKLFLRISIRFPAFFFFVFFFASFISLSRSFIEVFSNPNLCIRLNCVESWLSLYFLNKSQMPYRFHSSPCRWNSLWTFFSLPKIWYRHFFARKLT